MTPVTAGNPSISSTTPIPYRIRIGVTGTRTLPANTGELIARIRDALEKTIPALFDKPSREYFRKSPGTPLAFSITTALADGADRLVADLIMNLPSTFSNQVLMELTGGIPAIAESPPARLEPVLPLTPEDYRETFIYQDSTMEFERLIGMARATVVLRERRLADDYPIGNELLISAARHRAFTRADRHIVGNCDVLVAVVDERATNGEGFTAETIAYAKKWKRPVITIPTEKSSWANELFPFSVTAGHGLNAEPILGIEVFNSQKISGIQMASYASNRDENPFDNAESANGIPEDSKLIVRENLFPGYVMASKLAGRNQAIYKYVGMLVYCFSALAVAAVALGTLAHSLAVYAFSFELLLLLSVFMMVFLSNRCRTNNKWVESRYLAECLRAAMFFAVCGVEAAPAHVPPYMGVAGKGGSWTTMVFNEIWSRLPAMRGCGGSHCEPLTEFVRTCWLGSQIEYHEKKAKKTRRRSKRLEYIGLTIFMVAIFAPLLHLVLFKPGFDLGLTGLEKVLTFAALCLPAIGAAVGGIRSHWELSRIAKRSANMATSLREVEESFDLVNSSESLEAILFRIDDLMKYENQDWLMLMRPAKVHYVP